MNQGPPELDSLGDFLNTFNNESDRGAALVAAAMLDERLTEILKAFFVDNASSAELLSGYNAPLGTFAARVSAARALALIQDNEYKEITVFRKIRNEYGHDWRPRSFENGKLADYCRQLPWLGPPEHENGATNRMRFNVAIAILLCDLLWRVQLVQKERRTMKLWPNRMRRTDVAQQAVGVNGEPAPAFGGSPKTTLPAEPAGELDSPSDAVSQP